MLPVGCNSIKPWTFRVAAKSDELLSSYLARVAYAHGATPYRFYSFHLPCRAIWSRDIDRSASEQLISDIAKLSSLEPHQILSMTLCQFESVFKPLNAINSQNKAGVCPWINTVGIFHRYRTGYGVQYCPFCLHDDMTFKKVWRLSFATVCAIHNCSLTDCCPHCDKQIIFHRTDSFYPTCHFCGGILTIPSPKLVGDVDFQKRKEFQSTLLQISLGSSIRILDREINSSDFFAGLSILMSTTKASLRLHKENTGLSAILKNCSGKRIEQLRIDQRTQQCLILDEILFDWPNQFLKLAELLRMTQLSFDRRKVFPEWLNIVFELMPKGVSRYRKNVPFAVCRQLEDIQRVKLDGWRTERAKVLITAAITS